VLASFAVTFILKWCIFLGGKPICQTPGTGDGDVPEKTVKLRLHSPPVEPFKERFLKFNPQHLIINEIAITFTRL